MRSTPTRGCRSAASAASTFWPATAAIFCSTFMTRCSPIATTTRYWNCSQRFDAYFWFSKDSNRRSDLAVFRFGGCAVDLLNDIAPAAKKDQISVVRFLVVDQFLEFCLSLQDGNKMIAFVLRHSFSYSGYHHSAKDPWNLFQYGKLIKLKSWSRSEIRLNLVRPGARRDLGSLGKTENEDCYPTRCRVGQRDLVAGKAVAFGLRHLRRPLSQQ